MVRMVLSSGGMLGLVIAMMISAAPATAWTSGVSHTSSFQHNDEPQKYFDTRSCLSCHSNSGASEYDGMLQGKEVVKLNIADVWHNSDLHSRTLEILRQSNLAQEMYRVLGYRDEAAKAQNCYTCHGVDQEPGAVNSKPEKRFNLKSISESKGIVCATCHGDIEAWQTSHYKVKDNELIWRSLTPAAKEKEGWKDLRDPAIKTARCASCHIGNASEGKIISHEMYAAGHPPLPPFELLTFTNSQPPHWEKPSRLPYLTRMATDDPEKCWKNFHYRSANIELHQTREFVVGVMVSYQTSLLLLAEQASFPNGMIDFAQFDCFACHHDLRVPSERQRRGYAGAPGRPPLKAWITVLPRIVLEHAVSMKPDGKMKHLKLEYETNHKLLENAILSQPFGKRDAVKAAAGQLAEWTRAFLAQLELEPVRYNQEATQSLLSAIIQSGKNENLITDPEAAWQIAWATNVLSTDNNRTSGKMLDTYRAKLESQIPLTVRPVNTSGPLPYNNKTTSNFVERQKLLSEFQTEPFIRIFKELK